jgi:hypothetical protein
LVPDGISCDAVQHQKTDYLLAASVHYSKNY